MHTISFGLSDDVNYSLNIEVWIIRRGTSYSISLVSLSYKHRMSISIRVHSHSFDVHFSGCLDHSSGDLASISNQDFVNGRGGYKSLLNWQRVSSPKRPQHLELLIIEIPLLNSKWELPTISWRHSWYLHDFLRDWIFKRFVRQFVNLFR